MSLACAHAHPCADILLAIQAEHGSMGVAALVGLVANIGDHDGDDRFRDQMRAAFLIAAAATPGALASYRAEGGDRS